jgi:hypothetical protein
VASAAFARHSPEPLHSLGTFRLRGFQTLEEVFAPAEGASGGTST